MSGSGAGHLTVAPNFVPFSTTRTEKPPDATPDGSKTATENRLVIVSGSLHTEIKDNGQTAGCPNSFTGAFSVVDSNELSSPASLLKRSLLFGVLLVSVLSRRNRATSSVAMLDIKRPD